MKPFKEKYIIIITFNVTSDSSFERNTYVYFMMAYLLLLPIHLCIK